MLTESPAEKGEIVDVQVLERTVARFRDEGIVLPTFAQLADPATIPPAITARLAAIGPDDAHPLNLFRVHWFNDASRTGIAPVPEHVVLPRELTGVDARIVVALGNRFPMIERAQGARGVRLPRPAPRHGRSSIPPATAPSGPRPGTTAAAASPSRG